VFTPFFDVNTTAFNSSSFNLTPTSFA